MALTTAFSKIIEIIILNRIQTSLHSTDNQFGFKTNVSTEMCIFAFKQVLEMYNNLGSPVYVCFLDASKAYDRVNHNKLFKKLCHRKVPLYIVKLLCYWYSNQPVYIKWGTAMSNLFTVGNGVRQGGILSPALYNVYIDELSIKLSKAGTGCNLNGKFLNNFFYADDLAVLAPSPRSLQKLITVCEEYGIEHDIIFNSNKSVCMCIAGDKIKLSVLPNIYLNGFVMKYVKKFKYLGVYITEDLSDDNDISRQISSIYTQSNTLIRLYGTCCCKSKVLLFKSYCSSFYCSS